VENPVPWEGQRGSLDEYYERPTPEELATHLAHALDWVDAHPDAADARAVLIYAWNEKRWRKARPTWTPSPLCSRHATAATPSDHRLERKELTMPQDYTIACYYFPNYHIDPRNVLTHGANWTEWELAKLARPRFPGHRQPRVPLWGYEDESDPAVMARKIDGAADHGIDVFLFDWYHYDDGPFLIRALEEGFLRAPNNDRLRFAIHWANHDWVDIHPAKLSPRPIEDARVLYPGAVSRVTFDAIVERVIETYFKHPSYWSIAGCPYFSCYDLAPHWTDSVPRSRPRASPTYT